jgi:predicted nucleotidyltransferase component of viral defense system
MSEHVVNLPVSVLHRLRNKARAEGRNPQEVLRYYAIERFLYRLAQSDYAEQFVLKGALIFLAWGLDLARPTRDIDLAGFAPANVETVSRIMREVCRTAVIADGMEYEADSVRGAIIREGARYLGVRISIDCALGKARSPIRIDIGTGDAITPGVVYVRYPTLIEMPAPELRGYPPETVIAEKVEAMVTLGEINSRMKDFYDVWLITRRLDLEGSTLQQAIQATFQRRQTGVPTQLPPAFTDGFASDKQAMWNAFIARNIPALDTPSEFHTVVAALREFVAPLFTPSLVHDKWSAEQGWR